MPKTAYDDEALQYASQHYGIPADDPRGERILRRSLVFATHRLHRAIRQLGRDIRATVTRHS